MQKALDIVGALLYTIALPICAFVALFIASELGPQTAPKDSLMGILAVGYVYGFPISIIIGIVTVWTKIFLKRRFPWSQVLQLLPWLFILALCIGYVVKYH